MPKHNFLAGGLKEFLKKGIIVTFLDFLYLFEFSRFCHNRDIWHHCQNLPHLAPKTLFLGKYQLKWSFFVSNLTKILKKNV